MPGSTGADPAETDQDRENSSARTLARVRAEVSDDQAVSDLPFDLRSLHASTTRSLMLASAFFDQLRGS